MLYRQGKVPGSFYDGFGQEAVSAGPAWAMHGHDRLCILHRDLAAHLIRGVDAGAHLRPVHGPRGRHHAAAATATCTSATARVGCVGMVSMLPDMMLVATGLAMAFKLRGEQRAALTWFGDGSTSRGDFHEAMNWAGVQRLPVIFVLENNQYAYSTPTEPAVRRRPRRARRRLRLPGRQGRRQRRRGDVRGDAPGARARDRRRGPDDDRGRDDAHARPRRARRHEVRARRADRGVAAQGPDRPPGHAGSRRSASTSRRCAPRSRPRSTPPSRRRWPCRCPTATRRPSACSPTSPRCSRTAPVALERVCLMPTMTYLQAISDAMREEMRADERVFVMGEDIGVFGGAFKVTDGFIDEFGPTRVMDTPLAESAIVGTRDRRGRRGHAADRRDAVRRLHLVRLRPARQRRREDVLPPGPEREHHRPAALAAAASPAARSTRRTPRRGSCTRRGSRSSRPSTAEDAKGLLIKADPRPQPGRLHGAQAPLPAREGRRARGPLRDAVHRARRARGDRPRRDRLRRDGPHRARGDRRPRRRLDRGARPALARAARRGGDPRQRAQVLEGRDRRRGQRRRAPPAPRSRR